VGNICLINFVAYFHFDIINISACWPWWCENCMFHWVLCLSVCHCE